MVVRRSARCYLDVIEVERAGGGRTQTELVLLLADLKTLRVPVHDEAGDAFVSLSIESEFVFTFVHYVHDCGCLLFFETDKRNKDCRAEQLLTEEGSTFAITRKTPACSALLIHILDPLMT